MYNALASASASAQVHSRMCKGAHSRMCKGTHLRMCKGAHSRMCKCVSACTQERARACTRANASVCTCTLAHMNLCECAQLIRTFRPFTAFILAILRQLSIIWIFRQTRLCLFQQTHDIANNWRLSLLYNPRIRCPRSGQKKIL